MEAAATALAGIESVLSKDWTVRGIERDPCSEGHRRCDAYVVVAERTKSAARPRWAALFLYNEFLFSAPDRAGHPPSTRWETADGATRAFIAQRAAEQAITAASPLDLMERLALAGDRWPTMTAAESRHLALHAPPVAWMRMMSTRPGELGEQVRLMSGLGSFATATGSSAGQALAERIAAHDVECAVSLHHAVVRETRRELHEMKEQAPFNDSPLSTGALRVKHALLQDPVLLRLAARGGHAAIDREAVRDATRRWHERTNGGEFVEMTVTYTDGRDSTTVLLR